MRRRVTATLALLALIAATALSSGAGAAQTPRLRLAGSSPLKLAGSAFKSRERVRVTVTLGGEKRVRSVRASRAGLFTATFEGLHYRPCGAVLSGTARGSKGSRASLKQVFAECPVPY